jgi:hypothetical protein
MSLISKDAVNLGERVVATNPQDGQQPTTFVIGFVDEINGKEGEEVPEYVATRHELRQLAVYWSRERLNRDIWWFLFQQTGSTDWRWSIYIDRRLDRLQQILGEEVMTNAFDDVSARWRKLHKFSDEDWRVFVQGSEREQEAWREARRRKEEGIA